MGRRQQLRKKDGKKMRARGDGQKNAEVQSGDVDEEKEAKE